MERWHKKEESDLVGVGNSDKNLIIKKNEIMEELNIAGQFNAKRTYNNPKERLIKTFKSKKS